NGNFLPANRRRVCRKRVDTYGRNVHPDGMQGTTLLGWVIGVTIAAGALIDGWVRAPTVAERWAAAIGLGHAADQAPFLAREFRRRLLIRRTGMIVGTLTMLALQPQRHFAHLVNPVNGYVLGVL